MTAADPFAEAIPKRAAAADPFAAAVPPRAPAGDPFAAAVPHVAQNDPFAAAIPHTKGASVTGRTNAPSVPPAMEVLRAQLAQRNKAIAEVEHPKAPRPSFMRTASDVLEAPFALMNAAGRSNVAADGSYVHKPGGELMQAVSMMRGGKLHEADEEYGAGMRPQLTAEQRQGSAVAAARLKYPVLNAGVTLVEELFNPSNVLVNPVVDRGLRLGGAAVRAARAASPAVERVAQGVEKTHDATVGRLGRAASSIVGPITDRYYRVRQGAKAIGAAPAAGESLLRAKDAGLEHSTVLPHDELHEIFGETPTANARGVARGAQMARRLGSLPTGTDRAQRWEIFRRSQLDEDGQHILERNAEVPDPKGQTLDERAIRLRKALIDGENRVTAEDERLLPTGGTPQERADAIKMHMKNGLTYEQAQAKLPQSSRMDPNTFLPMRKFSAENPVYAFDDEEQYAREPGTGVGPDQQVPVAALRSGVGASGRVAKYNAARLDANGRKRNVLMDQVDPEKLSDRFDPAYQFLQHRLRQEKAIANSASQRLFEQPIGVDGAALRVPVRYEQTFPDGEVGTYDTRESAMNAVRRQREGMSENEARAELVASGKVDPALVSGRATNATFLRGRVAGLKRGVAAGDRSLLKAVGGANRLIDVPQFDDAKSAMALADNKAAEAAGVVGARADEAKAAADERRAHAENARTIREGERDELGRLKALDYDPASRVKHADVLGARDQMHAAEVESHAPYRDVLQPRSILPDYVWNAAKKRYELAGEYADVPRKYLVPRSQDPRSFAPGAGERVAGNLDELASEIRARTGDDAFTDSDALEYLRHNATPVKPSALTADARASVTDAARAAHAEEQRALLEQLGDDGEFRGAVEGREKSIVDLEREAKKADRTAARETIRGTALGSAARAATQGSEQLSRRLSKAIDLVRSGQANVSKIARQSVTDVGEQAAKVRLDLEETAQKYFDARASTEQREMLRRRTAEILHQMAEHESVANYVDRVIAKAPRGYVRESDLRLGIPSATDMAIEDNLARTMREQGTPKIFTEKGERGTAARAFGGAMTTLNSLAKTSIIAIPTVHAIFNLGGAYMAELSALMRSGERVDLSGLGRVLRPPKTAEYEALKERAREAGAFPGTMSPLLGQHSNMASALTRTGELHRALASGKKGMALAADVANAAAGNVDRYVSSRFWEPNQKLVFDVFEHGYAIDLFDRFTKAGMTDGEAAKRIRKAFGDYGNITEAERNAQLTKLFYFYPWMKTVIPFYVRKGIADPAVWDAPTRAVQANNEQQGYDDPGAPLTATTGKNADGTFRRRTIPLPQRAVEIAGSVAKMPFDLLAGDRNVGLAEGKRATDMLAGHLNPLVHDGYDAGMNMAVGWKNTPKYERFIENGYDSHAGQLGQAAAHVGLGLFGPGRTLGKMTTDPQGAITDLAGFGMGSSASSAARHASDLAIGRAYAPAIQAARARGDEKAAQALYAEMLAREAGFGGPQR